MLARNQRQAFLAPAIEAMTQDEHGLLPGQGLFCLERHCGRKRAVMATENEGTIQFLALEMFCEALRVDMVSPGNMALAELSGIPQVDQMCVFPVEHDGERLWGDCCWPAAQAPQLQKAQRQGAARKQPYQYSMAHHEIQ